MDELIVLLVRWIARMLSDRSSPPGTTGRGTPALPPARSGGGPATTAPALPTVPRPAGRRSPPPLRQPKLVHRVQPVQSDAGQQAVLVSTVKPAAVAVTHTGITRLRSSFTSESIRTQWVMYELLQPPLALRESR